MPPAPPLPISGGGGSEQAVLPPPPTGSVVEEVKQQLGMQVSSSRTWILMYSVLTWLITLAFFFVVLTTYEWKVDQSKDSFAQKRGIVQSIGCLQRKSFVQWNLALRQYEHFYLVTDVASSVTVAGLEANTLLQNVLQAMNCSTGLFLYGGQETLDPTFMYSSPQCSCVVAQHRNVFSPRLLAIVNTTSGTVDSKKAAIRDLGKKFSSTGEKDVFPSMMQTCFFAYRPAQWVEVDQGCFFQVVPYAMVMFINTIAGCFAGNVFPGVFSLPMYLQVCN